MNRLNWFEWLENFQKDLKVGLVIVFLLFAFRIALLMIFHNQIHAATDFDQITIAFIRGLQFDIKWAILAILPLIFLSLISSILPLKKRLMRVRLAYARICVLSTLLLGVVNIGFFQEYHEQFNHSIFGLFHDDFIAIIKTSWEIFPVVKVCIVLIFISFILSFCLKHWLQTSFIKESTLRTLKWNRTNRAIIACFLIFILFLGARGRLLGRPLQKMDIDITSDPFLNKIISNPYAAIFNTIQIYFKRQSIHGLSEYLKEGDIGAALKRLFPGKEDPGRRSIDDWLGQEVRQDKNILKPKHLFLIVMESQDSWPLLNKYEALGLASEIKKLAQRGIWVPAFVSSGDGTIASLSTLITGMPEVGVYTHYQASSGTPYPTAIAMQFKKLGYRANLWYGGYLSWERLGDFALDQGFDAVYGAGNMEGGLSNPWGVHDKKLFDFILVNLDPNIPSFNLIMTTSNHPTYQVDLNDANCPIKSIPPELAHEEDGSMNLKVLGHFWYGDDCVGYFVEKAERKFKPSLFSITGDHWSRRFLNTKPNLYERKSVPFIIYGPEVIKELRVPRSMAGSHMDIASTLFELIAPKGTHYVSLGRNLLDDTKAQIGFGAKAMISPTAIGEVEKISFEKLPWVSSDEDDNDRQQLEQQYRDIHAIGWWRIINGTQY